MLHKPVIFCHSISLSPLYKDVIVDDLTTLFSLLPSSSPSSSIKPNSFAQTRGFIPLWIKVFHMSWRGIKPIKLCMVYSCS